ncbi:MAG: ATP-dependent Clp protease ATP-binding subunit, partial [Elusimicrobia bacterium]|nr:ATP-dependent Clp protease ATP-binding subunit [Elusimicrobiota bacterium]
AAAVAVPQGRRSPRSVLSVLRSAARSMGAAVGAHFDGSSLFGGAAAGALNGVADEGGDAGRLPESAVSAVLDTLRMEMQKGEAFTTELEPTLADMAGVQHEKMPAVLAELARRGHIAALANGARVFVEIPEDSGGSLSAARRKAKEGLALLNDGHFLTQAKAFNRLREASALYASSVDHGNPAAKDEQAQVEILRLNAGLEFLRSYLTELSQRTGQGEDQNNARQTLQMVKGSYFGTDYYPDPLNKYAASWLRHYVERHRQAKGAVGDETAAAIDFLPQLADALELKSEALPKLLPAPAPAPKKGSFALISKTDSKYENLNKYGTNLSALAAEGKLSPLVGRQKEIRQMVKTLMRVEKNNPVVIGEKGVGKTKAVEGLAQLIVDGKVPELAGVNIIKLDVAALVAGTKYRGEFEQRLKGVMDEAKAGKGKVLLFIDELHTIVGLGAASGSQDASQMLKEALSSGELSLIGATTLDEYRKIEKDPALARRFNPIKLAEPTPAEAVEILEGVKARYEKKHGVTIPQATVEAAVRLAARYEKSRSLPDSALDLIDDASAEVALQNAEAKEGGKGTRTEVTPDDVAYEINLRTGIPTKDLSEDDLASLKKLPESLDEHVVGQTQAVDAVVRAIRRGRLGYREEKAPIGTFVFLGPTGVGKTEFVRVLAKNQFGSEKNIVRIDMSEYQEKHSVSRLIGAPPGFVGYESAGQLTEAVRRNPHTVILLDEIEKAAPEVLDLLLQVIEDGRLTDGQGKVVDFSNTIIVMTSNIGGSLAGPSTKLPTIGFIQPDAPKAEAGRADGYLAAFKATVRPEFFNRIGKRRVVVFNELTPDDMGKILDLRVADLNERIASKGMKVRLSAAARGHILADAASPENRQYGARPLKQAVAHEVEDALVDGELDGLIKKGDAVLVDYDAQAGKLTVSKDPEAKTAKLGGWALGGLLPLALAAHASGAAMALAAAGVVGALAYGMWRVASSYTGPNGRAQAPPSARVWAARAGLLAAGMLAADWTLKALFWHSGLFVFHDIVHTRAIMMAAAVPLNAAFGAW